MAAGRRGYGGGGFHPFPQQHFPSHLHQHQRNAMLNSHYLEEFHRLKEEGNKANTTGNHVDAVEYYSHALEMVDVIEKGIGQRDVAKVYSNRSLAFFKLQRIEYALDDAMVCVEVDPTWPKGYWRVASALKVRNEPIGALKTLVTGYKTIKGDNEDATKVDFIKEIAILSNTLKGWPEAEKLFYSCKASRNVWSKVVLQLARQKETKVLYHVFLGGGPRRQKGVAGMATNCDAAPIKLNLLLRSLGPSDRNRYGMDLMLTLIKHGADWKDLSIKTGDTPLHVALHHGMEIANYDFLKYLFSQYAKSGEERSRIDSDGSTILHIAAKQRGKQRQTAVLFLVNEKVDPCVKDKKGKTAADYIDDWALAGKLRSEMQQCKHENHQPARDGGGDTKKKQSRSYESGPQPVPAGAAWCGDTKTKQPRIYEGGPQPVPGAAWCGDTKKNQPRIYEGGPQSGGQAPPNLQERTRRPYSSATSSSTPTDYGFSKITADMPERVRRPYSSLKDHVNSQPRSGQKAPQNQNDKHLSKTKMKNTKKQKYQKEQVTGYERGCQLKDKKQYDKALAVFLRCMESTHQPVVEKSKQEVLKMLELPDLKEISPDVKSPMSPCFWDATMLDLQDADRWRVMFLLLNGGGNDCEYGQGGVAMGCNVLEVSIMRCLKSKDETIEKIKIIKALLENGSRPNGLPGEGESPIKYCLRRVMKDDNYVIITALIRKEARPKDLVEVSGDSPLHAGLRLCLSCNDRKMDLLNVLLDKYSKTKNDKYLDPTETNTHDDDTLFHIALNEKDEALSLEAVKLLSRNKVNPYLKNKAGKIPITQIKKIDRRYQFLEEAARHHSKKGKRGGKKSKDSSRSKGVSEPSDSSVASHQESIQKVKQDKKEKVVPGMDKNELKRKIAALISEVLPVIKQARIENKKEQKQRGSTKHLSQLKDVPVKDSKATEDTEEHEVKKPEDKGKTADRLDDLEAEDLREIDSTVFDNLTWEVECTAKVWKFLRDRRVPEKIKQAVVNKVQLLGEGNWTKSLAKPLTHSSDHNIHLYEVKVTSGGRIIWQKAIAFSPKRSVIPEERLTENKQEFGGVEGGRIYADVIRVWDVILDHDNVHHAVDVIVKSVDRGQECILQKKLKGLKNKTIGQATRIPNLYQEILSEDISETLSKKQDFFPPASSKETEYHIMKFYSFSSSLVNNILHESSTRVDFPFRVTEKEHAIIHINPKPPCSLLLLGRSGTGKTTCCLYRLWSYFLTYWTDASFDGEPRIPRDFSFRHSRDEEPDDSETESPDDEGAVANLEGSIIETDSEEEEEEEDELIYDHLHQIFITKNRVLCSEVLKNFRDLAHGCSVATHYLQAEDQQLPHRFQDAPITAFPYFLNSRQFLLMLDASLPGIPFFERNPDGSLKKDMKGWQDGDNPQPFLDMMDMDDESEEDDDNDEEDVEERDVEFDPDAEERVQKKKGAYDVRHEVTYDVFANTLWIKINKKNLSYHPTLVWMEIRSFIKGSVEALHSDKGKLDLEDYQKLGRKRAPNFSGDRKEIYELFQKYEHMKKQRFYFDEADVVFNIYRRLQDVEMPDWAIHQIYVDETQDFTQAELALLIRCCSDPNAIFLTGDTAQSIMRGVAFRFDDLKSLFHYARSSMKALGKQSAVAVPKKVYQLTHNYRSHAGILELAASVVDLLSFFFPTSFDRLKRDQGLFDGPKPVLLDSCSTSDLALILRGNKRKTSEIEFGAHQVILVANEEAKEHLPEELSLGLCLTIFEAKGLEFDDVMIYNFFKDSPARDEWRVVQEHLHDIQNQELDVERNGSNLFELDIDVMNSAEQPRKLVFDPDKHKVLNSELKYLYTAISRARVNVWIFDEDTINRKPMFLYFKARKLVRVLEANPDLSSQSQFHDFMFVEKSSAEDWEKRGDYFYSNGLWEVAVKCYLTAGNDEKVLKAKANHRVNEAEKMKGTNVAKMCEWYLEAAYDFLQCGMYNEAARCLFNTKAFKLSAQLFEQIGDVAGAAKIYETRLGSYRDASRCHEKRGDYATAVKVLKLNREYDKAADVIERYEQRKAVDDLPECFIAPRDTIDTCCHRAAKQHYQNQAYGKMLEALNRLPNVDDRITFLKGRNQHQYAVDILKSEGRLKDAAEILKATGDLLQAIDLCRGDDQPEFRAECHLKLAKQKMRQLKELDLSKPINPPNIKHPANIAVNDANDLNCKSGGDIALGDASRMMERQSPVKEKIDNTFTSEERTRIEVNEENENKSGDECEQESTTTEVITNVKDGNKKEIDETTKLEGDATSEIIKVVEEVNTETCEISDFQKYELNRKALIEDVKKHAGESLRLLKVSKDSAERLYGDCEFILAELNNDVSKLKDAKQHFRQACSVVGVMECTHLYIQLEGEHANKTVDNLIRLYDLIYVLKNYDGVKGQQKVNSAEHFYGIDLGASSQSISQWREDKFKHARLEVIRNHCLPKAVIWSKLVEEKLVNTEMKMKQCPLYATGRLCTRDECKHSHSDYRRETILDLVQCFVSMIRFVHCAKKWKQLRLGDISMDIQKLTDVANRWEYQPCSKLYDLVFPSHCNRRIVTENHKVIKDLLKIIRLPEVKLEMTGWVLDLRRSLNIADRNCDSNVYLKALNVHRLVKESTSVIKEWMKDDETECTKYSTRPLGIWFEYRSKSSYMHRLLEYSMNLHFNGDPIKAIGSCNRFLVFIANRPWPPLIPSISNTVAIIEHAVTVACAVTAKANRTIEVFLPASYLAQLQFQDELCKPSNWRYNTYQSVDGINNMKPNELLGQVRNFVEMMICGDKYRNFDIIPDAFTSRQDIDSGEAERSLILALVMLCNFRNLLGFENAFNLRCQLVHIQTDDRYPPRLARAVESLKMVKSLKDLMDVLQTLLMKREAEFLMACRWSSERSSRYHKLNFDQVVTERYKNINMGSLALKRPMEPIIAQDDSDISHDTRQDVDEDVEQKELFEKQIDFDKKCFIISKIRSKLAARHEVIPTLMPTICVRGMLAELVRAQILVETVEDEETLPETHKDEAMASNHWFFVTIEENTKVEEMRCGICMKALDAKLDERDLALRPGSPVEGETSTYYGLQREVSANETNISPMEEHVLSQEHIEKQKYFENFKWKMIATLIPLFEETDSMYKRLGSIGHADLEVFHDRVKESRHRFNKSMADMVEKHTWGEFDKIHSWLIIYNKTVRKLNEMSNQMEQLQHEVESNVAGGPIINSNDDVAEQIRDEPDDEDLHQTLDIAITKKKQGKGGRQKAKKKRKQSKK